MFGRVVANTNPRNSRPKMPTEQKSTFQKLLAGMSTTEEEAEVKDGGVQCSQGKITEADGWTVDALRGENAGLKGTIVSYSDAIDDALAI